MEDLEEWPQPTARAAPALATGGGWHAKRRCTGPAAQAQQQALAGAGAAAAAQAAAHVASPQREQQQQRVPPAPPAGGDDFELDGAKGAGWGQQQWPGSSTAAAELDDAAAGATQPPDSQQLEGVPDDDEQQDGPDADSEEQEEEEEVELLSADQLSREQVVARIEALVADLVAGIAAGRLPQLTCVSTAASNVHLAPLAAGAAAPVGGGGGGSGASQPAGAWDGEPEAQEGADAAAPADGGAPSSGRVLQLGSRQQTKTLLAKKGAQALTIVRVLQLLDSVHEALRAGRTATQRDLYYSLVGRPGFSRPRDVTAAIRALLATLRLPRAALGISAASKGAVAGCLLLRSRPGEPWTDCRNLGSSGRPIPAEAGALQALEMRPVGARLILVVEKDAVFQALVEARLHEALPCILITGRGMPDLASRAFLAALVAASATWQAAAALQDSQSQWPSQLHGGGQPLPVVGLVDWNPGGVAILAAYKQGSAALGLEGGSYAVPSLAWLGVTSEWLQDAGVPTSRCHALSARDRALLPGLAARLARSPEWVAELEEMAASGLKADIEALGHDQLLGQLRARLLGRRWLA